MKISKQAFSSPGKFYGFAGILKVLRKKLPAGFPVKVEIRDFKNPQDMGGTMFSPTTCSFKIQIRKGMSEDMASATLLHEWAHVLSWGFSCPDTPDHGPEWGVAYSRVYRALEKEPLHRGY